MAVKYLGGQHPRRLWVVGHHVVWREVSKEAERTGVDARHFPQLDEAVDFRGGFGRPMKQESLLSRLLTEEHRRFVVPAFMIVLYDLQIAPRLPPPESCLRS